MGLTNAQINTYATELLKGMRERITYAPLTERTPEITIDDAYAISLEMFERRVRDGEKLVGKKVGVTSIPVQEMLGVHRPDFGYLLDTMQYENGADMPISKELISPRAEGEIAFTLKTALKGPGVTAEDVLAATDKVFACFEIVDSRVADWRIKIEDTVADNASCGLFLIGDEASPEGLDFANIQMRVYRDNVLIEEGVGHKALGSPLNCVAWLANTFGELGISLNPGDIVLSGSLVPLIPVQAGQSMRVEIDGIGSADVNFT